MKLFNKGSQAAGGKTQPRTFNEDAPRDFSAHGEDGLVPETVIAKLRSQGRFDMLADVTVDRGRWFLAFLMLGSITLFSAFGWYVADGRFSNNVRVAWVKLDPSGGYTVDYADSTRPIDFFQTTLESKLTELVEKRYRKAVATIVADYRFIGFFLSPQMVGKFLSAEDYNAPRVAAELTACKGGCTERDVRVRVVQHRSKTPMSIPDQPDTTLYESQVFITFTERRRDGTVIERSNAIVQVAWRLRSKGEISANKAALVFNPLGVEVMSMELKNDPTPVPKDDKAFGPTS
jgi:hypothetical protein